MRLDVSTWDTPSRVMITSMRDWLTLTQALARTMHDHAPGWTDRNDADPGITMLEMVAYLIEGLQFRRGVVSGGAPAASRIVAGLQGYAGIEACVILHEGWSGTKRPRFFSGRLLSADDLGEEQNYHLGAHRRHLQTLHGSGIARGLQVKDGTEHGTITIEPGLAIDAYGREINLADRATVAIPSETATPAWIVLAYAERMVDPVPSSTGEALEPSRIEEGCRVFVGPSCESGVAIARVARDEDDWRVDPSFAPVRAR